MQHSRRWSFQDERQDSTTLLQRYPIKDLAVKDKDAAKVLFLSVNPFHKKHDDEFDEGCRICRLWSKCREAVQTKSVTPLKRELKVRTLNLSQHEVDDLYEESTLESNFSEMDDELSEVDEELLTFTEVLTMLQYPTPDVLREKLQKVLLNKKIPVRKIVKDSTSGGEETMRNNFLAYTNSKILSEICDTLSPQEVYAMKEFALKLEKEDSAVNKLAEFVAYIDDPEALEKVEGLKEAAFFFIILTMYRESLLYRLYTHPLEHLLKGARDSLRDPDQKSHIEEAIGKLRRYPMTSNPPGICVIFNMTDTRDGAKSDAIKVKHVFENEFNYDVLVKTNSTARDVKNLIAKLNSPRYMFYDSLVVFFMAHGDKTYLRVKDGQIHRRNDLIQPFSEIEWLNRKPKLFFIQACANKRTRSSVCEGTAGLRTSTDSLSLGIGGSSAWKNNYGQHTDANMVNSLADTLVSYATMWYQTASRNEQGSLYINTLLDCLKERGKQTSIENVLREMHYKVNTVSLVSDDDGAWKQTPYYESSLQKEFIFPS